MIVVSVVKIAAAVLVVAAASASMVGIAQNYGGIGGNIYEKPFMNTIHSKTKSTPIVSFKSCACFFFCGCPDSISDIIYST